MPGPRDDSNRAAIFWDYENCAPSPCVDACVLTDNIRRVAIGYGSITMFNAYADEVFLSSKAKSKRFRATLQNCGVQFIDTPHKGEKDIADKVMITDMLAFAVENRPPATVILITGDSDFARAAYILRTKLYRVVLVTPRRLSVPIRIQASDVIDWDSVLSPSKPVMPSPLRASRAFSQNTLTISIRSLPPTSGVTNSQEQAMCNENPLKWPLEDGPPEMDRQAKQLCNALSPSGRTIARPLGLATSTPVSHGKTPTLLSPRRSVQSIRPLLAARDRPAFPSANIGLSKLRAFSASGDGGSQTKQGNPAGAHTITPLAPSSPDSGRAPRGSNAVDVRGRLKALSARQRIAMNLNTETTSPENISRGPPSASLQPNKAQKKAKKGTGADIPCELKLPAHQAIDEKKIHSVPEHFLPLAWALEWLRLTGKSCPPKKQIQEVMETFTGRDIEKDLKASGVQNFRLYLLAAVGAGVAMRGRQAGKCCNCFLLHNQWHGKIPGVDYLYNRFRTGFTTPPDA